MNFDITILGELTLRVVSETYDSVRLGTISKELIGLCYSSDSDRIKTEAQFLMRHLIENPHLSQDDLIEIATVNPFLAAHAVKTWPQNAELSDIIWRCHSSQIINDRGAVNVVPFRGLMRSKVLSEEVLRELVDRLSVHANNGPQLLSIVRDHHPGKMIVEQVLRVDWLPARLRRKIECESEKLGQFI